MPPKSPLAQKFGIPGLKPITPKDVRESIRSLILVGVELPDIARQIRARYRAGEWDEEIAAGSFAHLKRFKLEDWSTLVAGVRATVRMSEINAAQGLPIPTKGRPSAVVAQIKAQQAKDARSVIAEAELEEIGDDAKKRLERLRNALMKRLTIDEQADLLVSQARSDHGATSRSATAHIIEILGMKAANVAEAPGSAPIFVLPEGAMPGIR